MAKEEKKSILENALTDYKQIQEAAEAKAAKKLAEEFPDKFQNLLKEEINNNNKSDKEPYKKVNNEESNELDESEEKNTQSEMKKENKKETKKVTNEEREKSFMPDIENDTPNTEKDSDKDGVSFKEKTSKDSIANKTNAKEGTKKKSDENKDEVNEEFNVTDLDADSAENAIDNADADDEVVTMEEIEKEISEMENLKDDLDNGDDDPYAKLDSMKDKLQEMLDGINQMEEQKKYGGKQDYKGREKGGPTTKMIDEKDADYDEEQGKVPGEQDVGPDEYTDEQKKYGGKQDYKGREKGGPTTKMIDEEDPITDDDIEAVLNDEEVAEALGIAHSSSKHVAGDHLPGEEFGTHRHKRYGSYNNPKNESISKKFKSLLEENKQLSKKINESNKYKETVNKLLENYKTALEKYRSQLKEMAVFNTNLSHVNNILVNESLALTQEDKIKVINNFKSINTIGESKKKYHEVLNEMKEEKKTISENVENKFNNSVGKSSKENLVEEKTAYENDEHIGKMKKLIEHLEKRDTKKIIK